MTSNTGPYFYLWAQSLHNRGNASDAGGYDASGQSVDILVSEPSILKREAKIREQGKRWFPSSYPCPEHLLFADFFVYGEDFVLRIDSGDCDVTGASSKGRISKVICVGSLPSNTQNQEWTMAVVNALRHFCNKTNRVSFSQRESWLKHILETEVIPKSRCRSNAFTSKRIIIMFTFLLSVLLATWLSHH